MLCVECFLTLDTVCNGTGTMFNDLKVQLGNSIFASMIVSNKEYIVCA